MRSLNRLLGNVHFNVRNAYVQISYQSRRAYTSSRKNINLGAQLRGTISQAIPQLVSDGALRVVAHLLLAGGAFADDESD